MKHLNTITEKRTYDIIFTSFTLTCPKLCFPFILFCSNILALRTVRLENRHNKGHGSNVFTVSLCRKYNQEKISSATYYLHNSHMADCTTRNDLAVFSLGGGPSVFPGKRLPKYQLQVLWKDHTKLHGYLSFHKYEGSQSMSERHDFREKGPCCHAIPLSRSRKSLSAPLAQFCEGTSRQHKSKFLLLWMA